MFNAFFIFDIFCPWMGRERQAKELALKTEANIRKLSGLPEDNGDRSNADIVAVLRSTNLLAERLLDRGETPATEVEAVEPSANETTKQQTAPEQPIVYAPAPEMVREPELSGAAKELIELRDWVLLAKTGDNASTPELLESLYQQLGQVLEKEGVKSLEDTGVYNYERQEVIATRAIDDPDKDDLICETVRPGYMFNGKLVRFQEVTIYTYDASTGSQTPE